MGILRDRVTVMAACWKGGGGGGSSSGASDFPQYMKDIHQNMLTGGGSGPFDLTDSVLGLIHSAIATSPYSGEIAYDPDTDIAAFVGFLNTFDADVDAIGTYQSYVNEVVAGVNASTQVQDVIDGQVALLDDRLTMTVLPRFQTGMRDINAVNSSSFVIGQAILEGMNTRDIADFSAKLKMSLITDGIKNDLDLVRTKIGFRESVTKVAVEAYRIKVVMKKEELDEQMDIEEKDYRWGIDLFQAGSNVMSSISGSAISTQKTPSKANSVLGGALSGAAAGATIGGPMGAGIGAAAGALMSFM